MKPSRKQILLFIVAGCLLCLSAACTPLTMQETRAARMDQRISFNALSSAGEAVWETNDISLSYRASSEDNILRIQGTVEIKSWLLRSFPNPGFFHLYLNLLDSDGRVIDRKEINPNFSYGNTITDPAGFRSELELKQQPAAIAFGYWGHLRGEKSDDGGTGDWYIEFNPFGEGK